MKTFFKNQLFSTVLLCGFISSLLLTSCDKEKDEVVPTANFAGKYTAEDSNNDKYTMTLEKKEGNKFLIHNFGGFMYVPIYATASGEKISIPSQTFKESNFQLTLKGEGSINGDNLQIHYEASGSAKYEEDIWAIRKK